MGRRPINREPPTLTELLDLLDRWELVYRRIIGRWYDSVPPQLRAQLSRPTNEMLRVLMRAGRR